jgi:hypothetical protein
MGDRAASYFTIFASKAVSLSSSLLVGFARIAGKGKRGGASVASIATEVFKGVRIRVGELENPRVYFHGRVGEAFLEGNIAPIVSTQPATPLSTFISTPRPAPAPARTPLTKITNGRRSRQGAEAPSSLPVPKRATPVRVYW